MEAEAEEVATNLSLTKILFSTAGAIEQIKKLENVASDEITDLMSQILIRDEQLKKAEQKQKEDSKTIWSLQSQLNTSKQSISKLEEEKKNMKSKHQNELKDKTEELSTYHREYSDFVAKLKEISEFQETPNSSENHGKGVLAHVQTLVISYKRNAKKLHAFENCLGTMGYEKAGNEKNLTINTPSSSKSISKSKIILKGDIAKSEQLPKFVQTTRINSAAKSTTKRSYNARKPKSHVTVSKQNGSVQSSRFNDVAEFLFFLKRRKSIKQRKAASPKYFRCSQCPLSFRNFGSFKGHVGRHHPDFLGPLKKYSNGCTLCGEMFETKKCFKVHLATFHKSKKPPGPARVPTCSLQTGQQGIKAEITEDGNMEPMSISGNDRIDNFNYLDENSNDTVIMGNYLDSNMPSKQKVFRGDNLS